MPLLATTIALPLAAPQVASTLLIAALGLGFTVTVTLVLAVQPLASVTVKP